MIDTTEGWLLGGRIRYAQPRTGFRTGIEPVLIAAAVPAVAGQRALEAGTGAGAGLLCLVSRIRGIEGLGVEREPGLAALANANLGANGVSRIRVVEADVTRLPPNPTFDHAFANPPWHPASGTAALDPARVRATRGADLGRWITALAAALRRGGTLTFILPAASMARAMLAAEQASCGNITLFPLWPKQGRAAKLVLLQAVRAGRASPRLLAGLTLHREDGRFTTAAEAVLREGSALDLGNGTSRALGAPASPAEPAASGRLVWAVPEIP
ncbi:MAG: tRNA1(Val) (adenine(37)-N6)-methyltransferase [Acetobacteraceae bacterium]